MRRRRVTLGNAARIAVMQAPTVGSFFPVPYVTTDEIKEHFRIPPAYREIMQRASVRVAINTPPF